MNTPQQTAAEITATLPSAAGWLGGEDTPEGRIDRQLHDGSLDGRGVLDLIAAGITADRAQRTSGVIAAVVDALTDRGATDAAERVRAADEDDLWSTHLGAVIDRIEDAYSTAH